MSDTAQPDAPAGNASVPLERHVPARVKFFFGFGAIAFGIKDLSFALLLTFYFNQVIGVPATIVGSALLCALVFDAFNDPLIGHLSDNLKTRWGRRHPFLYGSAIPAALCFIFLWNPPELTDGQMFFFIFGAAFLVRASMSFFEVPMASLGPELTSEYHERTRLYGLRFFFGWFGGSSMLLITYAFLLVPAPGYPDGQLNPAGYESFALIGAVIMASVIIIAGMGTHSEIKYLPKNNYQRQSLREELRLILRSFNNPGFKILMLCTLFANSTLGLNLGLLMYFITYFWELDSAALAWFVIGLVAGIACAVVASAWLSKRIGKRRAAYIFILSSIVFTPAAYLGRVFGIMPENGDPILLPILVLFMALGSGLLVSGLILKVSMLTDVIEDDAERSGKRNEGIFFAGNFFVQKCVSGMGIAITAGIIALVSFPIGATPGEVPQSILNNLAMVYTGIITVLALSAAAIVSRFPIDQADHEARIARMRGAAGEATM
ncbi:MFS transporter [Parasphingopyxis sp.]|uniref:MFS transporter n=1 Tax=Parasphingopyxis sp. TaxID=1920299 RepID=UPI0026079362|nr:MFS transporter [Parasphingopyxis sp.]